MEHRFRISQNEMSRLYESAKGRMDAHPKYADEQKGIIAKHRYYKTEKDALQAALIIMTKENTDCQIWAKIKKGTDGIFRVKDYWLLTDDGKTKLAADYIGMALMYDSTRLQNIIDANVGIDDVVAYW